MPRPYTAPPLHAGPTPRILRPVTTRITCPVCRAAIPTGSAFCPACGNPSPTVITNERVAPSSPSPEGRGGQGVRTSEGSGGQGVRIPGEGGGQGVRIPGEGGGPTALPT